MGWGRQKFSFSLVRPQAGGQATCVLLLLAKVTCWSTLESPSCSPTGFRYRTLHVFPSLFSSSLSALPVAQHHQAVLALCGDGEQPRASRVPGPRRGWARGDAPGAAWFAPLPWGGSAHRLHHGLSRPEAWDESSAAPRSPRWEHEPEAVLRIIPFLPDPLFPQH